MVGFTNAATGGISSDKCVKGTFTSSKTSTQTSFSVTGVKFNASVVFVYNTSYTASTSNAYASNKFVYRLFCDNNGNKFLEIIRTDLGSVVKTTIDYTATISQSGETVTVTLGGALGAHFSQYRTDVTNSSLSYSDYGTFQYYIY